jgi:hypothetical protein
MYLIFSAYVRSLLVVYLTLLFAARVITEREISNLEADIKKNLFGLKGDFRSIDI